MIYPHGIKEKAEVFMDYIHRFDERDYQNIANNPICDEI